MTGESLEVAGERYSQPLECTHAIPRASTGFEFRGFPSEPCRSHMSPARGPIRRYGLAVPGNEDRPLRVNNVLLLA